MKQMRRIPAAALCLALCILLTSCTQGFFFGGMPDYLLSTPAPAPTESPTPVPVDSAPKNQIYGLAFAQTDSFQPSSETGRYNSRLIPLCYESLYTLDAQFSPQPLLANGWETHDNKSFLVTLRTDKLFWDGSPITAQDAVYSFNLAKNGAYAARFDGVTAELADENRLYILSDAPLYQAKALLDFPIVKENSGASAVAVGSGLYQIFLPPDDDDFLLVNRHHAEAADAPAERIELLNITNQQDVSYWLGNGSLGLIALDLYDPLSPGLGTVYERLDVNTGKLTLLAFNHRSGQMVEPMLRQVFALCLDRRELCQSIYGEDMTPSALPVPPASADFNAAANGAYRFDLTAAASLLTEAGYEDTDSDGIRERKSGRNRETLTLVLLVNATDPYLTAMAESYAAVLRSIGVGIDLQALSGIRYSAALSGGAFDAVLTRSTLSPSFDPAVFLTKNGALSFGYQSKNASAALDALHKAAENDLPAALLDVYSVIQEELPFLSIGFGIESICLRRGTTFGLNPTWKNMFGNFWEVSITP